jgi:hypothetical protein
VDRHRRCHGLDEGGFECRWQGVPGFRDHELAILIAAVSNDAEVNVASYRKVTDKIAQPSASVSAEAMLVVAPRLSHAG